MPWFPPNSVREPCACCGTRRSHDDFSARRDRNEDHGESQQAEAQAYLDRRPHHQRAASPRHLLVSGLCAPPSPSRPGQTRGACSRQMSRASMTFPRRPKNVDGRDKPGHHARVFDPVERVTAKPSAPRFRSDARSRSAPSGPSAAPRHIPAASGRWSWPLSARSCSRRP